MVSGTSLLTKIPVPSQNWQTKQPAQIASIRVGDVTDDTTDAPDTRSFFTKFVDNLKEKLLQKRLKKLESIPPERRTPSQQAEIEANKQFINYMI